MFKNDYILTYTKDMKKENPSKPEMNKQLNKREEG